MFRGAQCSGECNVQVCPVLSCSPCSGVPHVCGSPAVTLAVGNSKEVVVEDAVVDPEGGDGVAAVVMLPTAPVRLLKQTCQRRPGEVRTHQKLR